MKKLRVGIIGQGRSGRDIHARQMVLLEKAFTIVAATDPIKQRRDRAAREFGCDVHKDYKSLLKRKDLDLVVNATPSHLHVPVTAEIMKAGHNVLVEKPLAKKAKDVDKLIALSKKTGKVFAIFQQSRFAPYFQQVMKVVDSGILGRIVQISIAFSGFSRRWDWQTLTEFHAGNLMNTGPHPLDQALRFMDLPTDQVPEVFCHMDRAHFWGDAEGHVNLVLRAPDRPLIDMEISSCCAYPCFTYQVYGTQGGLKGNTMELQWRYYKPSEAPKHRPLKKPICKPDGTPSYCREELKWYERKWAVPKKQTDLFATIGGGLYKNLYDHITKGTPLVVQPAQVRQQIAVIEEAHRQNPHIWGKKAKAKKK